MNHQVAALLHDLADLLDLKGENPYRVRAYREAARSIAGMTEDVVHLKDEGRLQEIPGVGVSIAEKIEEYLNTGRLPYYEDLRRQMPPDIAQLLHVPGLGPRRAQTLYEKQGISTLRGLEDAILEHRLQVLPGFGEKVQQNLLRELRRVQQRTKRMPLGVALPAAEQVVAMLGEHPAVRRIDPAGSIRRRMETIGDIDILVASDEPLEVMDAFTSLPIVKEVLAKGSTKSSVLTHADLQIDLRVIQPVEYGSALQYFTGSKAHNISLRDRAIAQGYKLSEYGLFNVGDGRVVAREAEEDIYRALGLSPIPPEMRENRGEIEAAARDALPHLVELGDIRGDLHVHTDWSDGRNSLQDVAETFRRLGYQYVAITDHSQSLGVAKGLSPERVREQRAAIDALNARYAPFRVLHGTEVNIHSDGTLDYDAETLRLFDFVGASIHGGFSQSRTRLTGRIVAALRHPLVDVICHPSGRLIGRREPYDVDMEEVIRVAAEEGKALEIDAQPDRMDLNDVWSRRAKDAGVTLVIDSDAHEVGQLEWLRYGVYVARRAWLEPKNVLNTLSLPGLLSWLRREKRAA